MSATTTLTSAPAVEREITIDMIKRSIWLVPIFVAFGAIGWGVNGALSVLIALAIVLVNFSLAAFITSTCARISLPALMAGILFGLLFRMGLIVGILIGLRHVSWIARLPLGISLIVFHLVLLVWETRYISGSLAFPGLTPKKKKD